MCQLIRSLAVLSLLLCANAWANDSTAVVGAGGLVLTKSDHIVMQDEDLFISTAKIRVAYHFKNTSSQDITTRVAFPLPEAWLDADGSPFEYSEDTLPKDKNLLNFSVTIDGKKQAFLSEDKRHKDADGAVSHKITHYWQQMFPAGKVVSVIHEYKPAVGGAVAFGMMEEGTGRYCITKDLQQWIDKKRQAKYDIPTAVVSYILKTGANWKGPIGKFKLTIKKAAGEEKISFCGSDVQKIDEHTFVMEKTNFTPKRDLDILFLRTPYKLE